MPGGLPDCLTAPRPGSLALTPLHPFLLSSALFSSPTLLSLSLPRSSVSLALPTRSLLSSCPVSSLCPLVTIAAPSFSLACYRSPLGSPLVFVLSRFLRRDERLSSSTFSVSLSLSLARELSRLSLHDLSRLYLSPRPRHPSIRAALSLSLSLSSLTTPTRYRRAFRLVPSLPRSLTPVPLFPVPVLFETVTGSPMFGIVDAPLFIYPHL